MYDRKSYTEEKQLWTGNSKPLLWYFGHISHIDNLKSN